MFPRTATIGESADVPGASSVEKGRWLSGEALDPVEGACVFTARRGASFCEFRAQVTPPQTNAYLGDWRWTLL